MVDLAALEYLGLRLLDRVIQHEKAYEYRNPTLVTAAANVNVLFYLYKLAI